MGIRNLVVSEQQVSEELLEKLLSGYLRLAEDTRRVMFTPTGVRLSAREKILLVLAAQHAWRFLTPGVEQDTSLSLNEIAEQTGIRGNTLRPTIKRLKDDGVIVPKGAGRYQLPVHSLATVADDFARQ